MKAESVLRANGEAETLLRINIEPRGSGNRNMARRVGAAFKADHRLKPHIKRTRVGASSVIIVLRPSVELMRLIWEWQTAPKDAPGQMLLPGVQVA